MLAEATNAILVAWLFAGLLAWARCMPKRKDGRSAVSLVVVALFLLAWAGGPYLSAILHLAPSNPFAYAFVALLASAAIATLARPVEPEAEFDTSFLSRGREVLVRLPNRRFTALMGFAAVAVVARYAVVWPVG